MRQFSSATSVALAITVLGALAAGGSASATDLSAEAARFQLPSDPDQVVISFTERISEIDSPDSPSLHVYASGLVVRHRPEYLKQPGDYVGQLSTDELDELLHSLAGNGIMEFDPVTARNSKVEAQRSRSTLSYWSDPSVFEIVVHLEAYQPAGSLRSQQDFRKTVSWSGLRHDARQFPELPAIQGLASACLRLDQLAQEVEREALAETGEGGGS